jgi:hypothetical protein
VHSLTKPLMACRAQRMAKSGQFVSAPSTMMATQIMQGMGAVNCRRRATRAAAAQTAGSVAPCDAGAVSRGHAVTGATTCALLAVPLMCSVRVVLMSLARL